MLLQRECDHGSAVIERVSPQECCYREGVTTRVLLQRGCHPKSAVIERVSPQECCYREGVTTRVLLQRGCHPKSAVIERVSLWECCYREGVTTSVLFQIDSSQKALSRYVRIRRLLLKGFHEDTVFTENIPERPLSPQIRTLRIYINISYTSCSCIPYNLSTNNTKALCICTYIQ